MNIKWALLFFSLMINAAFANERIVLTINNGADSATYTIKQLEDLPSTTINTITRWTEGTQVFEGVLLNTLISKSQSKSKISTLTVFALNDYSVEIPMSDLKKYPVLLAYKHNGKYMKIRNKGPLWIIYPLSDYPELALTYMNNRWIWQIKSINLK